MPLQSARRSPSRPKCWRRGEPGRRLPTHGVPISFPLRIANWLAANGGHLGFSPVLPPDRAAIEEQVPRSRELFRRHDFDFYGGVTLGIAMSMS